MVRHIGMKVVTAPAIDQAQLIAVHHEGSADTMPTNEGGKTFVKATDAGTLETCGDCSGAGDNVRVWRRRGGDEDVRRKQFSHGKWAGVVALRGARRSTRASPTVTHVGFYCASNSSYIN